MLNKRLVLGLCAGLALSACGALTETPPQTFQVGGVEIASRNAEEQMAIFVTPDDVENMCLAPAPDAAVSLSEGLSIGQVGETGGTSAVALGGRTGVVLLARELLYRACEFSQNYDLSKKEAYDFYLLHLQTITKVGVAQQQEDSDYDDSEDDSDDEDSSDDG